MLEIVISAKDEDAWELLAKLNPGKGRIKFCRAKIDNTFTIKGDLTMIILTNSQEVDLAIQPLDKRGKPAQVDGTPAWASSDATKATVTPAEDGLSCVVKAQDNGACQISVSADADLGEGVLPLTGVLDLEIVSGQAASLSIIAGTPREQAI